MEKSNADATKWYLGYDAARILSLVGVILTHITAYFIITHPNVQAPEFIFENIINGFSRFAVPVFLMITGALLLNEDKKFVTKKFLKNSWFNLVWITLLWVVIYGVFYGYALPLLTHNPTSFNEFIGYLINFKGSDYPHLWYMYMIIGTYVLIPILRLFVKKENKEYVFWMIIACILVQFIPETLSVFTIGMEFTLKDFLNQFFLYPFMGYIGYILAGWYISNFDFGKKKILYIAGLISIIFSIYLAQTYITLIPAIRQYVYAGNTITCFLYSIAVFTLILNYFGKRETKHGEVKKLSRFTFGIYMIHVLFLELFTRVIYPYSGSGVINCLIYIVMAFIFVFALSYLLVLIVSKVKYLRKVFYLR